ncbi:periplasmic heavy metal sensor [Actomonas aquatica]|uniref:Periplasmic heavy metal sensor n=1 Tax=Actomonas aquatica TaxID=2866162 RepID=A0ABZ1CCF1_9BACT|nr:periplasmic heavy metal sensor [Opitutus sp. WL0086]WRQ89256.1 periplasmic heavy metal sensor [Opitutus sp. WL0086]
MKTRNAWVAWLVLIGVFLAGGVTGGFVSLRVADALVERGRAGGEFIPRHLERLDEELNLTPEQEDAIRPILEETWATLREYRRSSVDAMRAMEPRIIEQLDAAQKEAYVAMQEKHRQRWQRLVERRQNGKGGPGSGGPRPDGPPPEGPPPAPPADVPPGN